MPPSSSPAPASKALRPRLGSEPGSPSHLKQTTPHQQAGGRPPASANAKGQAGQQDQNQAPACSRSVFPALLPSSLLALPQHWDRTRPMSPTRRRP
jgi:hypothetical protein